MRNQLVRLEQASVIVRGNLSGGRRYRWARQMGEGRIGHGERQKNVHGRIARKAGIAYAFGDAQATIDFHRAGVAALHLRKLNRGCVALNQRAAHAAAAQVKSKREAYWSRANNEDLSLHHARYYFLPSKR